MEHRQKVARRELSALIYSERALCYAVNVGAFGGLLSSPHHPISSSPYLHLLETKANFLVDDTAVF